MSIHNHMRISIKKRIGRMLTRLYAVGIINKLIKSIQNDVTEDIKLKKIQDAVGWIDDINHYFTIPIMLHEKYNQMDTTSTTEFPPRIAVYSASFGDYDDILEPTFVSNNIDYILFTDDSTYKSDIWKVHYVEELKYSPKLSAKEYKFFPEKYLREYDFSVWVDGKVAIRGDVYKLCKDYIGNAKMLFCSPGKGSTSIYELLFGLMNGALIEPIRAKERMKQMIDEGMPMDMLNIDACFIARFHNDVETRELMSEWWQEVNNFSMRDQASFPYLCWKRGYHFACAPFCHSKNPYFYVKAHKKDRIKWYEE